MFCIAMFKEMNHAVFSNVLTSTARRHFAPTPLSKLISIARAMCTKCAFSLCARQFYTAKELHHFKGHLVEGRVVSCPVIDCKNVFTKKSAFTAHMSRKHKRCFVENISYVYREMVCQSPRTVCEHASQIYNTVDPSTSESCELPHNFNETSLRNVCLFYLKLQGQLLVPDSTIQIVVEEIQNVHELGQDFTRSKLHSLLKNDIGLTDDAVTKICD